MTEQGSVTAGDAKVLFSRDGAVARITLNREAKLNALDVEMIDSLESIITGINRDSSVRVVLLDAVPGRAFCAGADIKAWSGPPPLEMWRNWTRRGHDVFELLERLLQPTIAMVDAIAYGGGLELALSCDLLCGTAAAKFAFPETGIAAVPGWGGTFRLAERIGVARAKQMIYTGVPISAERAYEWGLVNELYPDRAAMEGAVAEMAVRIAANAPVAVAACKQLLRAQEHSRWLGGAAESIAAGLTALTADGAEGVASFKEKRAPKYRGN